MSRARAWLRALVSELTVGVPGRCATPIPSRAPRVYNQHYWTLRVDHHLADVIPRRTHASQSEVDGWLIPSGKTPVGSVAGARSISVPAGYRVHLTNWWPCLLALNVRRRSLCSLSVNSHRVRDFGQRCRTVVYRSGRQAQMLRACATRSPAVRGTRLGSNRCAPSVRLIWASACCTSSRSGSAA